jgi:phosphoglycolate phosphatase
VLDRRGMAWLRGLLFDLDGVLIDSLPSIAGCMNYALAALGRPTLTLAEVRPLVGPPLEDSAPRLLGTSEPAQVEAFAALYRRRYAETCVQETTPAAGLHAVLATLAARWPLAVATNKPEVFARQILTGLGVAERFAGGIHGRSLALDHAGKAQVIARAMQVIGGPAGLVMVGDREHDVHGAAVHGVPTIGVLHGMGTRDELEAAGARWIATDLLALPGLLERIDGGSSA